MNNIWYSIAIVTVPMLLRALKNIAVLPPRHVALQAFHVALIPQPSLVLDRGVFFPTLYSFLNQDLYPISQFVC
jgi:hypothetical protein